MSRSINAHYHDIKSPLIRNAEPPFTYSHILKSVGPYALSRLAVVLTNLATAFTLANTNADSVAAAPLIISVQFLSMGIGRGNLLGMNNIIAAAHGRGDTKKIYEVMSIAPLYALLCSIPTCALFATSQLYLEHFFNTPTEVAYQVFRFTLPYFTAVFPIFIYVADLQFALGIERSKLSFYTSWLATFLAIPIGVPLSLATTFFYGTAGIATGISIASWLIMFGLKLYFIKNRRLYNQYGVIGFSVQRIIEGAKHFKELLSIGTAICLMMLSEEMNILALSLLESLKFDKYVLMAIHASIQCLASGVVLSQGFAQGICSLIENERGRCKKAIGNRLRENAQQHVKNIKMISFKGQLLSLLISLPIAVTLYCLAEPISRSFLSSDTLKANQYATSFLQASALGIIPNAWMEVTKNSNRGMQDYIAPTLINFLTVTLLGLGAGTAFSYYTLSPIAIFWGRVFGTVLAASCQQYRFLRNTKALEAETELVTSNAT